MPTEHTPDQPENQPPEGVAPSDEQPPEPGQASEPKKPKIISNVPGDNFQGSYDALRKGDRAPKANPVIQQAGPIVGQTGQTDAEFTGERLDLPSKGKPYPPDSPLSVGHIMVRPITTKEEEILVTERLQRQGIAMDMIMSRCILTPGINTLDLVSGDRMYILLYLRTISYGKDYEFETTMRDGTRQKVKTDVSKIEVKTLSEDFEEPYAIQIDGTTYELRLSRGRDEQAAIKARLRERKAKGANATEVSASENLKNLIVSVNGETDEQSIRQHVDRMVAGKAHRLRKAIADMSPGPELNLEVVNEETGELEEVRFQLTEAFFRPSDD